MKNKFYVYAHFRRDNNKCFYIGKGSGKRAWDATNRNKEWADIVNSSGGFDCKLLALDLTEDKAFELEQNFINVVGIDNLTNQKFFKNNIYSKKQTKYKNDRIFIRIPQNLKEEFKEYLEGVSMNEVLENYIKKFIQEKKEKKFS